MAKKTKKQRKPMNPQTKRNLVNVFKGIISNQSCIDGAKEAPFFIAIIFFLLSLVLPLIPVLVKYSNVYGASFVASYSYNIDEGLQDTVTKLRADGFEFKVEGGEMTFYQNGTVYETAGKELVKTHTRKIGEDIEYYDFMFYISDKTGTELVDFVKELSAKQYESGTLTPRTEATLENVTYYSPSFIILAKQTMGVQIFKYNTTTQATATFGGLDWKHTAKGDLLARVADVEGKTSETVSVKDAMFNNWRKVFNETYENQKVKSMWVQTGIFAAVYAGLMLFMGFMIWLMTRGKTNPNRTINLWVAQKISWWAAFTPAVLGMIVGFIFSTNVIGQMGFIVLLSLRIMWLSMRQLRPM